MTLAEILAATSTTAPTIRATMYRENLPPRHELIRIGKRGPLGKRVSTWLEEDNSSEALHPYSAFGGFDHYIVVADYNTAELRSWAAYRCHRGLGDREIPRVISLEPVKTESTVTADHEQ